MAKQIFIPTRLKDLQQISLKGSVRILTNKGTNDIILGKHFAKYFNNGFAVGAYL